METFDNPTNNLPKFIAIVLKHCLVTGPYQYEEVEENILMIDADDNFEAYKLVQETVSKWSKTYQNGYGFDVVCTVKDIVITETFDVNRQQVSVISVRDFRNYESYKENYKYM